MLRAFSTGLTAVIAAVALASCTSSATPTETAPTPSATSPAESPGEGGSLPSCSSVDAAIASLIVGLHYDEAVSTRQTAPEAYEQRVCVFVSDDGATQLGVTIAAIPLLQEEVELYATMPGVIGDDRTADGSAVLQLLRADDSDDGNLDSALYLFDAVNSITIQGHSDRGELVAELPGLTVVAATEAAFAVRALL